MISGNIQATEVNSENHRMKNIYLLLCALVFCVYAHAQNSWDKVADFGAGQRSRAVAFSLGGRGYVATGQDTANHVHKDLWQYDPATNTWSQLADLPGLARRDAIAFSIGNRGYVGTGISHSISYLGTKQKDLYEYNPVTNAWTAKANFPGNFNQGIYFASAFATSTKGYLVCGKWGASYYSNELWEFNPATNTWTKKANFPGGVRYAGTAFAIGDIGYFGCGANEDYYCNDFYAFDPATNTWSAKADFTGSARFNPVGFSIDGRGFIGLGTDGGYKKDLYEYNPATDHWVEKADYGGSERREAVAFVINGKAYVGTGKNATGKKRSFYRYTPFFLEPEGRSTIQLAASVNPNPVQTTATIILEGVEEGNAALTVFDAMGRMVYHAESESDGKFTFDRGALPRGIYYYDIDVQQAGSAAHCTGKLILI